MNEWGSVGPLICFAAVFRLRGSLSLDGWLAGWVARSGSNLVACSNCGFRFALLDFVGVVRGATISQPADGAVTSTTQMAACCVWQTRSLASPQ